MVVETQDDFCGTLVCRGYEEFPRDGGSYDHQIAIFFKFQFALVLAESKILCYYQSSSTFVATPGYYIVT